MANLTFKDVGQGDSIILEWMVNDEPHVGVFDCNKKGKENPVLEHIREKGYSHIDFMVLSHPHKDHFSGFTELLTHCSENDISIGWFGDTAFYLGRQYWLQFEKDHDAIQELEKLIKMVGELQTAKVIERMFMLNQSGGPIDLGSNLKLQVLSPGHLEVEQYQEKVKSDAGANKRAASQAANLLSTVFLITSGENNVLVTSDAVSFTLDRIHSEPELREVPLLLVQAPHHGSDKNYSPVFWERLPKAEGRRAVVSSGHNNKYQHPHLQVLTNLDALGFSIHATNIIYGMQEYLSIKQLTIMLDMNSELVDRVGGDKSFSI